MLKHFSVSRDRNCLSLTQRSSNIFLCYTWWRRQIKFPKHCVRKKLRPKDSIQNIAMYREAQMFAARKFSSLLRYSCPEHVTQRNTRQGRQETEMSRLQSRNSNTKTLSRSYRRRCALLPVGEPNQATQTRAVSPLIYVSVYAFIMVHVTTLMRTATIWCRMVGW
jgi:hypothetical protein